MRLIVSPEQAPLDVPVAIRVDGATPGQMVTIRARMEGYVDGVWTSEATFLADPSGTIDLTRDAPLSGTYAGVDPMGLFWSMQREPGQEAPFDPTANLTVALTAEHGDQSAAVTVERQIFADNVVATRVREQGLVGAYFRPRDAGPHPPVLVVGGSGGGLLGSYWQAAVLARHGFATLALAYFAMESLPKHLHNIPLEYFETAMSWLTSQPDVRTGGVGVIGTSRGGELALLLGATYPAVAAVVAYVPSHVVWGGFAPNVPPPIASWTRHGDPVTILRRNRPGAAPPPVPAPMPDVPISWTPRFLRSLEGREEDEARAAIPVERINGSVLLISGRDDAMWPSSLMADRAAARLAAHEHPFPVEHLAYEGAGHVIYLPSLPATATSSIRPNAFDGQRYAYGGTPQGTARASADSWPRVVRFLSASLRRS